MTKKIVVGVIIASVALVICLAPIKTAAYTEMVEYEDTETYYEDEPYEDTETYYETEPLTYEVVKSYTDTDSYKERRRIVIWGVVFQDEVVEVFYPIGCVTLQNTDSVRETFTVQFTFYAVNKLDAGTLGGHPDFKFEDYLAAEDPDSYLDKLDWGKLDWDKIMIFCEEYNRQENITLQPGETGTVTASVQDIDINKMAWKWKYTITEATKTVEKQRTVTKYRQVERERVVTKQRPETHYKKVTLLDYLLHY
ncbi:hypothetical protein ES706_01732 [subsurface metagenome]